MDSDDVIDGVQGERLRQLVNSTHKPTCSGYVMQVHCPSADPGVTTVVDHVKLIRNRRDLRFEHRIHEQILPSIRRAGETVEFTDIFVVHHGSIQTQRSGNENCSVIFEFFSLICRSSPITRSFCSTWE